MNKILKSPNLLRRDPPQDLDRRILIAGAIAASRRRRMFRWRLFGTISGAAAAVALAVVATWQFGIMPGQTKRPGASGIAVAGDQAQKLSEQELLEFSDWTALEQENYNLASQLNCYQDVQDAGFYPQV